MSQITLQANLTNDLELQTSRNGNSYCNLVLAQSSRYLDGEEWKETGSKFWRVTIYGKQAEQLCACSLPKGTRLIIVGDLNVEDRPEWTDKTGVQHEATTEVSIRVKSVAVELCNWYDINVVKHQPSTTTQPAVTSAPKRTATAPKQVATKAPVKAQPAEEDIFGALDEDDALGTDDAVDLWG